MGGAKFRPERNVQSFWHALHTIIGCASLPLHRQPAFIRNDGQWESEAKFLLRSPVLDLWITGNGVVYDMIRVESTGIPDERQVRIRHAPVFISFEGAGDDARAT
jgi:hypothetical protein